MGTLVRQEGDDDQSRHKPPLQQSQGDLHARTTVNAAHGLTRPWPSAATQNAVKRVRSREETGEQKEAGVAEGVAVARQSKLQDISATDSLMMFIWSRSDGENCRNFKCRNVGRRYLCSTAWPQKRTNPHVKGIYLAKNFTRDDMRQCEGNIGQEVWNQTSNADARHIDIRMGKKKATPETLPTRSNRGLREYIFTDS